LFESGAPADVVGKWRRALPRCAASKDDLAVFICDFFRYGLDLMRLPAASFIRSYKFIKKKTADVIEHPVVSDYAGLLSVGPPS
jgi:hypothetical protein